MSNVFSHFITATIIANTLALSLDRYPEPYLDNSILDYMNLSFTVIFFLEMLIKLLGFGVKGYFQDNFNTFDCIIVVMSLLDLTLTYSPATSGFSSSAIQAMRAFRLLRIFKLAKSWTTF